MANGDDEGGRMERALGAYLGLAVGDALGATVEFLSPEQIVTRFGVHREIIGGGWLHLAAGEVTDDTEMSLALGDALLSAQGLDMVQVAEAFVAWLRSGPRDCGDICRVGIRRYLDNGSLVAPARRSAAGNGALMRNLPVVLACLDDEARLCAWSLAQGRFTHNHGYSDGALQSLGRVTAALVRGESKERAMHYVSTLVKEEPAFEYRGYRGLATGYVVDTVRTVLAAFDEADDFETAVVHAVNRGDDADTTGAIVGMLAGARFGRRAIPQRWLARIDPAVVDAITRQVPRLLAMNRRGGEGG